MIGMMMPRMLTCVGLRDIGFRLRRIGLEANERPAHCNRQHMFCGQRGGRVAQVVNMPCVCECLSVCK